MSASSGEDSVAKEVSRSRIATSQIADSKPKGKDMLSVIAGGPFDRPSAKVRVKDAEFTRTVHVSCEDIGASAHPYIPVVQTGPVSPTETGPILQHPRDAAGLVYISALSFNNYLVP